MTTLTGNFTLCTVNRTLCKVVLQVPVVARSKA